MKTSPTRPTFRGTPTARRTAIAIAAGSLAALTLPLAASASEDHPGCTGLYDQARFRTYQQVGDTHGHETVHHVFERLGCGDHHD